ncbi:hypothetical protein NQ314_005603 [Rhamnusium bicolor]|uniref:TMC domain-containing protein n=1 Tax=Rhamnusium bicolor TaxID=1586634 RepID=A0AAV8ZF42_9CUCU|nr:hypothetical protein NQ314_005603 [Rhamnusium bicolor]
MDRKVSVNNRPSLWTLTFEHSDGSKESLPTVGLRNVFNERNNIPMDNVPSEENGADDYDNLDDNYFDAVAFSENGNPRQTNAITHSNRVHSIHRNRVFKTQSNNIVQSIEARTGGTNGKMLDTSRPTGSMAESIENHANLIVAKMEQDSDLMEDSPTAEELRREALRDMPQCLTLKKMCKSKIIEFKLSMKNLAYSFELWYGTVKQIEGNFGSGVASFFKFLRWIFVMNLIIAIISFCFIVLPQVTFEARNATLIEGFDWRDIFSGEGYLTNTFFYYGFYSNDSVSQSALNYSMSDAYFFTMVFLYLSCFAVLSIRYEDYKSPKTMLYFSLIRTFILGFVIIGVLVTFWLKNPDNECWETSLGQEIYRLILFDFIFSGIFLPIINLVYYRFCRLFNKDHLHFDIAHYSMQIIYNQTLFWVGFFFSPFLAILVVIKLLLIWYVRKLVVLKFCKPSSKSWRAAQTTAWFLMMAFLSLLLVMGLLGYIMTYIPTTSCGPFRGYDYMYEIVTLGMFNLRKGNSVWKILLFITKPGFIALVLIALCVRVYYLRAKAHAQRGIVAMYREMLMWESRDKEFLLQNISLVTKGQWQYKLQEGRELDPISSSQSVPAYRGSEGDVLHKDSSRQLFMTPSSCKYILLN